MTTAWTLHVETYHGAARDADDLDRFDTALQEQARAIGACSSINGHTGVLGATFTVEEDEIQDAVNVGAHAFNAALEKAGFGAGNSIKVEIEPCEDRELEYA